MARRTAPVALLVALIAVAIVTWALVTAPSNAPAAAPQTGDAKARVCSAFDAVTKAVQLQKHSDLGQDPVARQAVAGNARVALVGGGEYLLNRLDPATPPEPADAVKSFGNNLQDIGMNALAGVPNDDPAQAARLKDGEASRNQIAKRVQMNLLRIA